MDQDEADYDATLTAAAQVFNAPSTDSGDPVELQGSYRGLPAEVKISRRWDDEQGPAHARWRVRGPTHGVILACSPPAVFDAGKNFTGNPDFDARWSVNGAPVAVLRALISPEVQQRMVTLATQLRFDKDCVECFTVGGHDEARARGLLDLAVLVLQSLPGALHATGLEPGALASHPEVATLRAYHRTLLFVIVGAVVLLVLGIGISSWLFFSRFLQQAVP